MFKIDKIISRSGHPSLKIDGISLHSSYDPTKEAKRFFEHMQSDVERASIIVLVEPGLNYLGAVIKQLYPEKIILRIHLLDIFMEDSHDFFFSENPSELHSFLAKYINEFTMDDICILTWPNSKNVFKDRLEQVLDSIVSYFTMLNANVNTANQVGTLCFKNTLRNFFCTESFIKIMHLEGPVIILAPGPSAEETIPLLQKYRKHYILVCLSSALQFASHYKLQPDFIIQADPGYYAQWHLQWLEDDIDNLVLTAHSKPFSTAKKSAFLIEPHSFASFFLEDMQVRQFHQVFQHGTVAGTAYYFLRSFHKAQIFFVGMDLQSSDLKSHAKPHSFDTYYERNENRFNPVVHQRFARNFISSKNNALTIYRNWFLANSMACHFVYPEQYSVSKLPCISLEDFSSSLKKSSNASYSCEAMDTTNLKKIIFEKLVNYYNAIDHFTHVEIKQDYILYTLCTSLTLRYYKHLKNQAWLKSEETKKEIVNQVKKILSNELRKYYELFAEQPPCSFE